MGDKGMLKKSWILAAVVAVIMLPAAIGTCCLWFGMDEYTLLWLPVLPLLMAPVVFLRILFIPYALCLLSACCVVLQAVDALLERRLRWHLPVTIVLTMISCTGLVSLEVFFPAMMGI